MKNVFKRRPNYQGTDLRQQREPDYSGEYGDLWRVSMRPISERINQDWDATVGVWFLRSPLANVRMPWFAVLLVHLRSSPGHPEPFKAAPHYEYDLAVFSLDPENPLPKLDKVETCDPSEGKQICTLDPCEFTAQFAGVGGDERAYAMVDEVMVEIVDGGQLIPAETHRLQWSQALTYRVMKYRGMPPMKGHINADRN